MDTLAVFTLLFCFTLSEGDYILEIAQGKLKGSILKSRNGRNFTAFQGIPYAKPPVNELRFEAPVAAEKWKDVVLDATKEPASCIQKNLFFYQQKNELMGKEDCLYLNVYTPKNLQNETEPLIPVMVFIPGGGFSSGQGGLSLYGPQYLMDKDVVVVSMNYRLGILGFLSTEDNVLPGNYGMKDQVLALQWVQNNIHKFGGDRNRVTIFGQSAGSVSVGLHLLSRMSKGLFQRAILESGTPLCRWAVSPPGWAKRRAQAFSTIAECPEDSKEFLKCLRRIPESQFPTLLYKFFEWSVYPAISFMPVVDKFNGRNSFLTRYPLRDFKQESNVPVLLGLNSGEGGLFAARLYNATGLTGPELKTDFEYYVSSLLIYKYTTKFSDLDSVGKRIRDRYFPDGNVENKPLEAVKMVTGGIFLNGIFDMATNLSSPVRYYVYDHLNKLTYNSLYGPYPKPLGVSHADELYSLFLTEGQEPLEGEDLRVSELMVDLWTNFASDKKLIYDTNGTKEWPLFDSKYTNYLLINSSTPVTSQKPFADEYQFWNSLPVLSNVPAKSFWDLFNL